MNTKGAVERLGRTGRTSMKNSPRPDASREMLTASCACGSVQLCMIGTPIACAACYCDDCQEGARQIEALSGAVPVRRPDGGTEYLVYRKDRVTCVLGVSLLKPYKIKTHSATNRVVAICCNSAMLLNFDDSKHWVDVYRSRCEGVPPPVQMRVCTRFRRNSGDEPSDVPSHSGISARLLAKLVMARMAMLLGP